MVVISHRVCLELYEHNDSSGAVPLGWWSEEHIRKRVSESLLVRGKRFIDHRCEWRKVLLYLFEFAIPNALAA